MKAKWFKNRIEHVALRAKERYDWDISILEYLDLCSLIKNSRKNSEKAKFVRNESDTRQVWMVKGTPLVYDKVKEMIITILPDDYLEGKGQQNVK